MDCVLSLLGPLAQGATVTLKLFVITLLLAVPLVLALARVSRSAPLAMAVNGYIWLMRGTPLMLQMLFIYFALPFVPVIGVRLPDFPAAVVAFALNYAADYPGIDLGLPALGVALCQARRVSVGPWTTLAGP